MAAGDASAAGRIRLLRSFDPAGRSDPYDGEVPDPYGGSAGGLRAGLRPDPGRGAAAWPRSCAELLGERRAPGGLQRCARRGPGGDGRPSGLAARAGRRSPGLTRAAAGRRPARLAALPGHARRRAELAFAKAAAAGPGRRCSRPRPPGCAGWRGAGAVPVPEVLGWDAALLVVSWVPRGPARPACRRAVRAGPGPAARGRRGPVRRAVAGVHRQPAAAERRRAGGLAGRQWYAERAAAAVLRRAADAGALGPDGRPAGRGGRRRGSASWPGPPSRPRRHPRRLLVRQRAVVRRARLADRPGGARRPPGDRPGHAGPVRRAVPGPDPGRATTRRRRWPAAGGRGCRCTSCTRCSCTPACSARVPRAGPGRRPGRAGR